MEGFNWSILGWVAGLVFVYLFGLFEGRSQGRKRRIAEEEKEKKEKPAPEPVKVDDPGLLRIRNENGVMNLDLDGIRVNSTSLTVDQRKRLIEMLNVIRPWLEGKPAPVPVPANPPPPSPKPVSDLRRNTSPQPAIRPTASTPVKPASEKKNDDEPESPPTSIVGQINLILQKNLQNTPLASRGISLMESPVGGVRVFVGVQRFEMIDDVPDEEIKAAIRAAITEWEDKYTPGL